MPSANFEDFGDTILSLKPNMEPKECSDLDSDQIILKEEQNAFINVKRQNLIAENEKHTFEETMLQDYALKHNNEATDTDINVYTFTCKKM